MGDTGKPVDGELLQYLSPLGWEHINLTGDYVWRQSRRLEDGSSGRYGCPENLSVRFFRIPRAPLNVAVGSSPFSLLNRSRTARREFLKRTFFP